MPPPAPRASVFRSVTSREWDPRRRRGPASSHPWLLRGLRLTRVLEKHAGCVNAVAWNDDASLLLSGSDDLCVCVWGTGAGFPLRGSAFTGHRHNIFSAEFVPGEPNGARCVTVAGDGDVRLVELERAFARGSAAADPDDDAPPHSRRLHSTRRRARFLAGESPSTSGADSGSGSGGGSVDASGTRHRSLFSRDGAADAGMGMKLRFVPREPSTFLTTHQDGRVRRFDLRAPTNRGGRGNHDVLADLSAQGSVSDLAFDPTGHGWLFAVGGDDPYVRVFDARMARGGGSRGFRGGGDRGFSSGGGANNRASSPSEREHPALVPVVAKYSPGAACGFNTRRLQFDGVSGLAYSRRGELAVTYRGEHLYVIDPRRAADPDEVRPNGVAETGAFGSAFGDDQGFDGFDGGGGGGARGGSRGGGGSRGVGGSRGGGVASDAAWGRAQDQEVLGGGLGVGVSGGFGVEFRSFRSFGSNSGDSGRDRDSASPGRSPSLVFGYASPERAAADSPRGVGGVSGGDRGHRSEGEGGAGDGFGRGDEEGDAPRGFVSEDEDERGGRSDGDEDSEDSDASDASDDSGGVARLRRSAVSRRSASVPRDRSASRGRSATPAPPGSFFFGGGGASVGGSAAAAAAAAEDAWGVFDEDRVLASASARGFGFGHGGAGHGGVRSVRRYVGHKNEKTFLKSVAFACGDEVVATGSDCGRMFAWDRRTCEVVVKLRADGQVVNVVCPHPTLPVMVTSGIDDEIRVWEPGEGRHGAEVPVRRNDPWDDDDEDDESDAASAEERDEGDDEGVFGGEADSDDESSDESEEDAEEEEENDAEDDTPIAREEDEGEENPTPIEPAEEDPPCSENPTPTAPEEDLPPPRPPAARSPPPEGPRRSKRVRASGSRGGE